MRTLRRHNASVPAIVFLYGSLARSTRRALREHRVEVRRREGYRTLLRRLCPRTWRPLALYPVLHKWLSLSALPRTRISQLLYVDCDTVFAGDVGALFERYAARDWYAREEPCTTRSPWGPRPGYLDERSFERLAAAEGAAVVPPYNLGVCLMNNGLWRRIAERRSLFLGLAWRFLVALAGDPRHGRRLAPELRRSVADAVTPRDRARALEYPSSNLWIVEQVALWLVLGTVPELSHGVFSWRDVLQGDEFRSYRRPAPGTVVHYFSKNQERIRPWLARGG